MRTSVISVLVLCTMLCSCNKDLTSPDADYPDVVNLPQGFAPEGMAFGKGTTLYVGSLLTGAIWKGDVAAGTGSIVVSANAERSATGMKFDSRTNLLFVAGGFTGQAYVYNAETGASVATYQLAQPADVAVGATLINDVVIARDAAYFTDSFQPVVYRLPLGSNGSPSPSAAVQAVPLTGDYHFDTSGDFNATGIAVTPDESRLILMNSGEGAIYSVDPRTGAALHIQLDQPLAYGDGIILSGYRLYVVQAAPDQVSVVDLNKTTFASAVRVQVLTNTNFAFPTAVAELGGSLYVLNGRFDVAPPGQPAPDVDFQVVRLSK